jgi:hypothetical protein
MTTTGAKSNDGESSEGTTGKSERLRQSAAFSDLYSSILAK